MGVVILITKGTTLQDIFEEALWLKGIPANMIVTKESFFEKNVDNTYKIPYVQGAYIGFSLGIGFY